MREGRAEKGWERRGAPLGPDKQREEGLTPLPAHALAIIIII